MRISMGGSLVRRIKKRFRTKPRFDSRDKHENQINDRYYECWNCGFLCKSGREEECDNNTPSRISHTEDEDYEADDFFPDYKQYGIDGTGCPFCHTPNWKGKY